MTTETAARAYLAEHMSRWGSRGFAVYNPLGKPVEELPFILGWNNGGSAGFLIACLLSEDGESLGSHACSAEGYMPHDLGMLAGSRPDRHETFREHYPDGYELEWVDDPRNHEGLMAAYELNQAMAKAAS